MNQFGFFAFAVSGTLAVNQRRLDLFGALVVAIVTAVGGGTMRDVLMSTGSVYWVEDPTPIFTASIGWIVTIGVLRRWQHLSKALPIADAMGLAIFCVLGAEQALKSGSSISIAIIMGVFTAVAGGIIRDVLSGAVPLILQRELYATAAVLGAATFVILTELGAGRTISIVVGMSAALSLRLISIRWNISLPVFSIDKGPS